MGPMKEFVVKMAGQETKFSKALKIEIKAGKKLDLQLNQKVDSKN